MLFILMLTGVGYVSWQLTRFIVWLDAADECEEAAAETTGDKKSETIKARRGASLLRFFLSF